MACKIEVNKPIFISTGDWPNEKLQGFILRELEIKPINRFVGCISISGKAIATNTDHVFGEYILETNIFSLDLSTNESLRDFTYQDGYLEKPILD